MKNSSKSIMAFLAIAVLVFLAPAQAAKKRASVELVNKSKFEIHHLYLSPTDTDDWGPDQLGKHVIETGGSFTLTDIDCDAYDVKLVDEAGDECIVTDELLCKDAESYVISNEALVACQKETAVATTSSVKLINKSKWDIHHLFLSPVDETEWGPDQFGDHVLEAAGTFTLTDITCDTYDVKVVDEDGDECVIEDAAICGEDLEFKITSALLLECEGYK